MQERNATHPRDAKCYDNQRLREEYLIENLFTVDKINMTYGHGDRMIIGGVEPRNTLKLEVPSELKANYFLERREIGIINVGGEGIVSVDGETYTLASKDGLYIGLGAKEIEFASLQPTETSKFYFISTPAHVSFKTTKINHDEVEVMELGTVEASNERRLYKYIHPEGVKSCQLLMGMTRLKSGSVWNSIPPHTHGNRTEVYLYFDLPKEDIIFHFMGEPSETKHMVVKNEEAIISPYWSIHSGVGTKNYSFIWAMGGENQLFTDANSIELTDLK